MLEVDTKSLTCDSKISGNEKMNELMSNFNQAIEGNYFSKIRSTNKLAGHENLHNQTNSADS